MGRRITGSMVVVVALSAGPRLAAAHDVWCNSTDPTNLHIGKPECSDSPGFGTFTNMVHLRLENICQVSSPDIPINVDLIYPSPATFSATTRLQPIVFQHGGGVGPSFCDKHSGPGLLPPYNCGAGHPTNPYGEIGDYLAQKGAVVMFPILNLGPGTVPYTDSGRMLEAVTCLGKRTNQIPGEGTCNGLTCITDLVNKVAWSINNKQNITFLGHSAGAMAGLYLPQRLGSSLKAMILLDPSKPDYSATAPSGLASYATHVVHIYPDWYGPLQNSSNQLFRLGLSNTCQGGRCEGGSNPGALCGPTSPCAGGGYCTDGMGCSSNAMCGTTWTGTCTGPAPVAGAWVPLGLREIGTCKPNEGCHVAQHCTAMSGEYSWLTGYEVNGHRNFCNPNRPGNNCAGLATPPANAPCSLEFNMSTGVWEQPVECSRDSSCRKGPTNNLAQNWQRASAYHTIRRYIIAYAACMGGTHGTYYQSWVDGKDRQFDDAGLYQTECTRYDGQPDAGCAVNTSRSSCNANTQCKWAENECGKAIRVNNGVAATEYNADAGRYYMAGTSGQGYNTTGVCQGGAYNGQACSSDAACGVGINCTAGDFIERQERLGPPGSATDPRTIRCQAGFGSF